MTTGMMDVPTDQCRPDQSAENFELGTHTQKRAVAHEALEEEPLSLGLRLQQSFMIMSGIGLCAK